jgi:NADPH:quinone reductase-like Zn-dependent oxidoreductase
VTDDSPRPPRRAAGRLQMARALWYVEPGRAELRTAPLPPPREGEARVRTLYTGVSRGTERLVCLGQVGPTEWERMRCPHQDGSFPFPVKYGYCAAGIVEEGPRELIGRTVFCLHPHQDLFNATTSMLVPVPDAVPARRATLAANMETALNALWDGGAGPGDRIVVVGAGIVGLMVASLAARIPGADVTVVDVLEARRPLAEALGARFALPDAAPAGADLVLHTSASGPGLATAIRAAGFEAAIVEMSWYGEKAVQAHLGDAFHSQRLRLVSSQVGKVSPARRERWNYRRRLEKALALLSDPALDGLVAETLPFAEAPARLPALLTDARSLAPVIDYGPAGSAVI